MFFESERSRDQYITSVEYFKSVFPESEGIIDAEYLSADRSRVFGISNLPILAPVCNFIMGEKAVLDYIDSFDGDIHLVYGDTVKSNGEDVPAEIDAIIK